MKKTTIAVYVEKALHQKVQNHVAFKGGFLGAWILSAIEEFLAFFESQNSPIELLASPPKEFSTKMVKFKADPALANLINESASSIGVSKNIWIFEAVYRKMKKEILPKDVWGDRIGTIRKKSRGKKSVQFHLTEDLYHPVKFLAEKQKMKISGWITEAVTEFYKSSEFEAFLSLPVKFPGKRLTSSLQIEESLLSAIEQQVKRVKKLRPAFSLSAFIRIAVKQKLESENAFKQLELRCSEPLTKSQRTSMGLKGFMEQLLPFIKS